MVQSVVRGGGRIKTMRRDRERGREGRGRERGR